jgi:hypothetical protein
MSILGMIAWAFLQSQAAPIPGHPPAKGDPAQTKTFFEYQDAARGLTLKMENGRVELSVPRQEGKADRENVASYKADSLVDFKRQYPEIAKKYDLDRLLPQSMTPEAAESLFDERAKRFGGDDEGFMPRHLGDFLQGGPENWQNMDHWFDREHQRLRDLEREFMQEGVRNEAAPIQEHGPRFGILAAPLGDALRAQLGLSPKEGVLVTAVDKGSVADTSGVKPYDVLVKISGQTISDSNHFRDQMTSALQGKEFVLDVIRRGSPLKLTVHPAASLPGNGPAKSTN